MNSPVLPEPLESAPQRNGEAASPETGGDARQRLLELRLRQRRASAALDGIIARRGSATAPMSYAQEGLWFLDRLGGPSAAYNVVRALRLQGRLDVAALEHALAGLVQRHESLRTGFVAHEGAAVQVVMPSEPAAAALRLVPEVLEEQPGSPQEALLQAWLERAAAEPFDLARAPLLRVRLLRLHEHEHVLLLVLHHIVSDGWSMNVLARELGTLYAAARTGQPSALAALPVQFADYAAWQHQRLQGAASAADLAYWRTQLAGLEALQLPTDRPRAAQPSHHGARLHFELEPALHARLQALARRENVTLFMLLLAALQVLLMRYSGQHDVAVGSPVAGRNRAELEGLIGYFVNTLVLRGDLSGRPSFVELLARTRQTCLQAYAHQELPFDRLVAELAPQRELGRNPLYQVSFALQNTPDSAWALQDLRIEKLPAHGQSAKFDLSVSLQPQAQGLAGTLEYSTELFDASTAERLARHFAQLLGAIAEQPEQPITRLALMSAQERAQVLRTGNGTAHAHALHLNLHQLFEAQVQRSPQAPAVLLDAEQLSYAELNERANRLAHLLRSHGVGPDVRVGLCLRRSPAMVVALLAILKAGGAYVPLDPQYPSERLAFMLADSSARLVITEQALLANLPADAARTTLCLDEPALLDLLTHQPDSNPTPRASPDHLAYVIYTSGSTGTPKGVAVTHRAVANLVVDTDYVRLGPADGVAQASNNSFDAATFEIWGALLNGARLIVVPKEVLLSATALSQLIEQHRINTMFLTTALFNDHVASAPNLFAPLDHLLFGGEAVDPQAVQRVVDARPPARLLHVYGPTETTTFATWHEVRSPRGAAPSRVPIGRALAGARCHILDAELEPVPIGVVGELYIGGAGLARGYLGRPELTAERFVDDPFCPGQRLYRTGDLARTLPDGSIDYVGRIDQQVKIRGFRIELGEIEAALAQQEGVVRSAVVVREDSPGDKRLVAYVVAGAGATTTATLLRERLAARLPQYMVPASVVVLDALPLTPNGKLDRNALPRPGAPLVAVQAAQHEPLDDIEQALRRIWEDVLDTSPIGLDQSFFDLGGHSLLAIKLLAAVEKRFGHALGLATLFDAPTIRGQASLLREPQTHRRTGCAVVVQPRGERMPLFFVSGFGGAILPFHRLSQELGPEQPLVVLDINSLGDFDGGAVSLPAIAAQMLRDLRAIQPQGPYHLAGFSLGGKIVYEMAQQLVRAGEAVGLLALLDCAAPGFPRRRSFAVRVALHVRHAMGFEKRQALAYLFERVRRLKKYAGFAEHVEPTVFKSHDVVDRSATLVQAIEARAQPIYDAWEVYVPGAYPGRLTLVCAEVRDVQPGVVEDDPEMGWGALVGGGVDVASLPCHHVEMLDPPYAPALAALLSQRLPKEKVAAQAPAAALA